MRWSNAAPRLGAERIPRLQDLAEATKFRWTQAVAKYHKAGRAGGLRARARGHSRGAFPRGINI